MFWTGRKRIYLDYASATPVLAEALRAMNDAEEIFGNPGSIHAEGVQAARLLESARDGVARELGCKSGQVIFTSGLTESNNLSILGYARKLEIWADHSRKRIGSPHQLSTIRYWNVLAKLKDSEDK